MITPHRYDLFTLPSHFKRKTGINTKMLHESEIVLPLGSAANKQAVLKKNFSCMQKLGFEFAKRAKFQTE